MRVTQPVQNSCISSRSFVSGCCALLSRTAFSPLQVRFKHTLDTSLVPVLNEPDIEEQFIGGSGPGGSNVNKNRNCVLLKHIPTGMVVKCHLSRLLQENRKLAREMLVNKLDEHFNGDMSLSAQKERLLQKKSTESLRKKKKLNDIRKKYEEFVANRSNSTSLLDGDNPERKE
jgi:protein subunit release factor B